MFSFFKKQNRPVGIFDDIFDILHKPDMLISKKAYSCDNPLLFVMTLYPTMTAYIKAIEYCTDMMRKEHLIPRQGILNTTIQRVQVMAFFLSPSGYYIDTTIEAQRFIDVVHTFLQIYEQLESLSSRNIISTRNLETTQSLISNLRTLVKEIFNERNHDR